MSTLGKVLLVLNLLTAGGLVYLTAQDWSKRQEISAVVLRFQLTLQGLPVEKAGGDGEKDDATVPIEVKAASGMTVEKISNNILKTYFQGIDGGDKYGGGPPVTSIVEELNRVEPKLRTQIEGQQGDRGKLAFLVGGLNDKGLFRPGLLMNLAESFEERAAIRALGYFPVSQFPADKPPTAELIKQNLDEAMRRLNVKIETLKKAPSPKQLEEVAKQISTLETTVKKDPNDAAAKKALAKISADGPPPFTRNESDRRHRMTFFLLALDEESAAWQKRVTAVAGQRTYYATINEQVARLAEMARMTERAIESDQATFEGEYELLKKLALQQDMLVRDQLGITKNFAETEAADAALTASRRTQLNQLNDQLAELQSKIKAVLGRQATAEKAVFDLQRKVGDTLRGNLELETKLDQAEQKKP